MLLVVGGLLAILVTTLILIDLGISLSTRNAVTDQISDVAPVEVALILGTSRSYRGQPNRFYQARIEAAARLFQSGRVRGILVSGDNATRYYNEPISMQKDLIALGVPADVITLDYAGFRTLDSMIRAKKVFGLDEVLVVSQRFHAARAVFLARQFGLDARGFAADDPAHAGLHQGTCAGGPGANRCRPRCAYRPGSEISRRARDRSPSRRARVNTAVGASLRGCTRSAERRAIQRSLNWAFSIEASLWTDPIPIRRLKCRPLKATSNALNLALACSLCLASAPLLSGCSQSERFPSGAITITVKPGDTGTCAISPCRVLFEMPAGEGGYQVLGNQVDLGQYPTGKIVDLGDFYEPIAIEVVDADVPKSHVYIPIEW
jgi:SanA protein